MNRVELQQAAEAVAERVNASLDGNTAELKGRQQTAAVLAGTDLPAHDVLRMLDADVAGQLERHLYGIPVPLLMEGVALNAFLFGFECGRRSK